MKAIPVLAALLIALSACEFERNGLLDDARKAYDNTQSPFGFHVTSVTDTSITLEWTADAKYMSYRLYRDMTFDMPDATLIYEGAGTSFYDSPLSSNTTYYYKLCGVDDTGGENCSKTIEARTGILPGDTSIVGTFPSSSAVYLEWSVSADATEYLLQRSTTPDFSASITPIISVKTSYTDTGLSPSTQYYYRVRGVNGFFSGNFSSATAAMTTDTYNMIMHSLIDSKVGSMTTGDIKASTIYPGDIFLYKTSYGRLGKFEVQGNQDTLIIRWVTYIDSTNVFSEGEGLKINFNDNCDFDSGVAGPAVSGDFSWGWDPLSLIPSNGAVYYKY